LRWYSSSVWKLLSNGENKLFISLKKKNLVQVVECLSSKHEAMISKPQDHKINKWISQQLLKDNIGDVCKVFDVAFVIIKILAMTDTFKESYGLYFSIF
jgi:hypothetical protein